MPVLQGRRAELELLLAGLARRRLGPDLVCSYVPFYAYRRSPRAYEHAAASEDAAIALACLRRLPEASNLFDEALTLYERAQAARDIARTHAAMRQHGHGRKRRGACKTADHWLDRSPLPSSRSSASPPRD